MIDSFAHPRIFRLQVDSRSWREFVKGNKRAAARPSLPTTSGVENFCAALTWNRKRCLLRVTLAGAVQRAIATTKLRKLYESIVSALLRVKRDACLARGFAQTRAQDERGPGYSVTHKSAPIQTTVSRIQTSWEINANEWERHRTNGFSARGRINLADGIFAELAPKSSRTRMHRGGSALPNTDSTTRPKRQR